MDVDPRGKVIDAPLVSDGTTALCSTIPWGRAEWIGEELDKGVSDTRQFADTETRPKIQKTFICAQLSLA